MRHKLTAYIKKTLLNLTTAHFQSSFRWIKSLTSELLNNKKRHLNIIFSLVPAINTNISWVCLSDILVCFVMYLMRLAYRYCSFKVRLLGLTLKVKTKRSISERLENHREETNYKPNQFLALTGCTG